MNQNNCNTNFAENGMLGTNPPPPYQAQFPLPPPQEPCHWENEVIGYQATMPEEPTYRQYQPLQQPKPVDGDQTYRVPSLQITLTTARTVSRPELVVEGLKDMCNLVEYSEPENPTHGIHISSYHPLDQDSPSLQLKPIPPPIAYDAGLVDTERMFSNLALSNPPPEEREDASRRRKGIYRKKIVTSPRSRALLSRCVGRADEEKICQVLYNMISQMESESSEQDGVENSQESACCATPLVVRSHANAPTAVSHVSEESRRKGLEWSPSPQKPVSSQDQSPVPTGTDSYIQPKPRTSIFRDAMQYIHQHDLTTVSQQQQQCRSSISCQCNLYDQEKDQSEKCQELVESKSTSTSDVPNNNATIGPSAPQHCAVNYATMIHPQASPVQQIPNVGLQQHQSPQYAHNGCSFMSMNGAGNGQQQQPVPVYFLQTTSSQQMPIFLVQNGGNPGTGIMGQQTPIFLQQVQCQQFSPQNQNLNQMSEAQGEQSEIKLTRVETRTLVQPTVALPNYDLTQQMVSDQGVTTLTKSLAKKPGQIQFPSFPSRNQPQISEDEAGVTFIVGPPPGESFDEMETLHYRDYPQKKQGIQSKPELMTVPPLSDQSSHRKKESYSDTQVNKVKMQQRNEQLDQEQMSHDYTGDHDDHCALVATPNTSSHTVTIRTYGKPGKLAPPRISSPEEDEDEESIYDPDCTLANRNYSISEPEPESVPQQSVARVVKHRDVGISAWVKKKPAQPKEDKPLTKLKSKEKSKKVKKPVKKEPVPEPELEIHGLYPSSGEPLEVWEPGFMKDKKSADQKEYDTLLSDKSVEEGITLIEDNGSWEKNVYGLKIISLKVQFYEGEILERLPCLVASISKHIRASGSKLARQAILTLRDLFIILGPHFDQYLQSLAERLFSKMANTNKFIKDDCEATLESMVDHCSQPKMIAILENVARRHKHSLIRLVAGRMITKFVGLVGPSTALQEHAHLILPLLCCNLGERTGEIREEARNALRLLVPNPDFDAYMRHHVNPQFIYSICEKLERIREEVSDRPRIRPKITRNHSLFKWQQKFSNTNLM